MVFNLRTFKKKRRKEKKGSRDIDLDTMFEELEIDLPSC